jgi:phosphate:Na+ symporter
MNAGASAGAGLGLFFVGMRLISSHLREMASGSIRRLLAQAFHRRGIAAAAGLLAGAVTQSTSAVTFVATGLVSAGALPIGIAVAMLAWANAGTSALVLLASLNVQGLALYLLALAGLSFFTGQDQSDRFRHYTYALLGLGLLLFGLTLVKTAVSEIRNDYWVREFVEFATSDIAVALLTGYVLAIALQSSSVVTVLALPLAVEGLVDLPSMSGLIIGACAGAGSAVVLVSSGLEGPARQLAMTQGIVRGAASLALLPLVLAESRGHPIGMAAVARTITTHLSSQVGLVFLMVQLTAILVAKVLRQPILKLAARGAPPTHAETLAKPVYLYDEAVLDPDTALELVRLEHIRLVMALADHLEDLREPQERHPDAPPLKERAAASAAVLRHAEEFLTEILQANPDMTPERVFDVRRRLGDLDALQQTLAKFALELASLPEADRPAFVRSLVEGMHALLLVVGETCKRNATDARLLLKELTAERSALVDRVRRELLAGSVSSGGREAILSAVLLFERMLWMLRERSPLPATETENTGRLADAVLSDTLS